MCTDGASLICEEDSRMSHESGKASRFPAARASLHRARTFWKVISGSEKTCERLM